VGIDGRVLLYIYIRVAKHIGHSQCSRRTTGRTRCFGENLHNVREGRRHPLSNKPTKGNKISHLAHSGRMLHGTALQHRHTHANEVPIHEREGGREDEEDEEDEAADVRGKRF